MTDGVPDGVWFYPLRRGDKLGNVEWVEFHLNAFLTSDFVIYANRDGRGDDVFRALLLWSECYRQNPAGTLPDDDIILSALCKLTLDEWLPRRRHILHGWQPCLVETPTGHVGRLGHELIAEIAQRTFKRWSGKAAARESQALATAKNRVRAQLKKAGLSRMAASDAVVTGIARHLAEAGLWLTEANVKEAAALFGAPRLVTGRGGPDA